MRRGCSSLALWVFVCLCQPGPEWHWGHSSTRPALFIVLSTAEPIMSTLTSRAQGLAVSADTDRDNSVYLLYCCVFVSPSCGSAPKTLRDVHSARHSCHCSPGPVAAWRQADMSACKHTCTHRLVCEANPTFDHCISMTLYSVLPVHTPSQYTFLLASGLRCSASITFLWIVLMNFTLFLMLLNTAHE